MLLVILAGAALWTLALLAAVALCVASGHSEAARATERAVTSRRVGRRSRFVRSLD